jgi:hypothetical protein
MKEFIFYDFVYDEKELKYIKDICFDDTNEKWGRIENNYVFGNRDVIHGGFDIPPISKFFDSYIPFLPELPREQFENGIKVSGGGIICDIKLARYNKGDDLTWHSGDWAYYQHPYEDHPRVKRQFTCITYLNDKFVGGETEFKDNILIVPEENKTLIFPAHWEFAHRGREVTEGTKYVYINHIWF